MLAKPVNEGQENANALSKMRVHDEPATSRSSEKRWEMAIR